MTGATSFISLAKGRLFLYKCIGGGCDCKGSFMFLYKDVVYVYVLARVVLYVFMQGCNVYVIVFARIVVCIVGEDAVCVTVHCIWLCLQEYSVFTCFNARMHYNKTCRMVPYVDGLWLFPFCNSCNRKKKSCSQGC